MTEIKQFLASVPRGFGDILANELQAFGASDVRERGNAVAFTGTLECAYRVCLESWVASRVYLELARFEAEDDAAIYAALRRLDWLRHIDPAQTLACEWSGRHPAIVNTHFGSLRLKDAICDSLRELTGRRPDIALDMPGVRIHAHAVGTRVTVSIDLAGEGLHRRGWRMAGGEAPLRENLAAGILLRAQWPSIAAAGGALLDPLCGSGTLVIEAARMAAGFAANHGRRYFGFVNWRGHDAELWRRLVAASEARALAGITAMSANPPRLFGRDQHLERVREARSSALRAGVSKLVNFELGALADARPPEGVMPGLLCTNPPWGLRLGEPQAARELHRQLGEVLRERFAGWQAAILSGDPSLGLELGLRAHRVHTVWNGALECRLLRIRIESDAERDLLPKSGKQIDATLAESPGGAMFANRIRKNLKQRAAWLRREGVSCYRLYDADMPEYAFAIDEYRSVEAERWLIVQEYQAPATIPEQTVRRRRSEALAGLAAATGVPADHIELRTRRRHRRGEQYVKQDSRGHFHVVEENGLRFQVNFVDYLDTGLFLDHRATRQRLRAVAQGRKFLNLFAYTGTATVYAAAGGATASVSVDLSATYLDWARENLALNGLDLPTHVRVRADVREWLAQQARGGPQFDLIFCDPPTFSNSKRMQGVLDIQRDHPELIERCMQLLNPGGLLVFSTNAQRFRLEPGLEQRYRIEDISRATLPLDFERSPNIHRCFEIRHPA